ncbi:MAG: glycosyltransferase involved in cell wall biosynthesis [Planctomycetota bacterium]|jgi:glycosyltransferase involved in cell wall biosynthesis
MRILFVLHTFPPESWGGTELHVQNIARELARRHEVRIFCRSGDPQIPHGAINHGFQEGLMVTRYNNLYEDYEGFESTWRHEGSHNALSQELDSFEPDIVHIHHLTGLSTTIVDEIKSRGLPVVFSLHDFWMTCPRGQRLHPDGDICEVIDRTRCHSCLSALWPGWFEDLPPHAKSSPILDVWEKEMNRVLGQSDVLLTPSAFHRDRMIETSGIDPRKFVALAHGLDHDMFSNTNDPAPTPRVIGYIGSVIPTKGVHVLIEAFKQLEGDFELQVWGHAPNWHEKGDYLAELKALAGNSGKVHFRGHYDNSAVPEILSRIDILVVPSLWWETFSLTIREAMLAGVPVIASDLGAMREAIAGNSAGLVFDPSSPGALARSIMRLVNERELRVKCASQRLQVKTLQQNASDYEQIYSQAATIAAERRNRIQVSETSFPKKKSSASAEAPAKDLRVSIEKIGGGEVKVRSAVKRGEQTQVSFVLDYGPTVEDTEIHLTVDFSKSDSVVTPAAPETAAPQEAVPEKAPSIPKDAGFASTQAQASQTKDHQKSAREEAMYKLDQEIFPAQVKALDDMVKKSHLSEGDRTIDNDRPKKPEGRQDHGRTGERSRDERPRSGQQDDRPRRENRDDRPRRDERPARTEQRPQRGAEAGRDERPRPDDRPRRDERPRQDDRPRRDDRPRQGDRPRQDERPRQDDRPRRDDRPRQDDRPRRDERPRQDDRPRRDDRPRQDDRPRREERPGRDDSRRPRDDRGPRRSEEPRRDQRPTSRPQEPKKKEAPKPKELTHDTGDTVWTGEAGWKLPTSSAPAPRTKPERAPNHRTGKQPNVKSTDSDAGFGDGV